MDEKGLPEEKVLELLAEFQSRDMTYTSGRILGSMCTSSHPLARRVYCDFLESNLGDPGLFRGTRELESQVIGMLGDLLSEPTAAGHIITGGTEANLMAMRAARNMAGAEKPEIIVPKSAHFSFRKAADILGLRLREAELDQEYRVDVESVRKLISGNTVAVVGVAGTTELGRIDPVEELSEICLEEGIHLHVDAAFGGFIIPFLRETGAELPEFDFKLEGVSSITVDPHKMGLAPIPSGCILFRDASHLDAMSIETPYLTEKQQSTIVGTRTGASAAATWAIMKHMGREGYRELALRVMGVTRRLRDGLVELDYQLVVEPELNIVAFNHPTMGPHELASRLEELGWAVSVSSCPPAIRVVLMPHIGEEHIEMLLRDLEGLIRDTHQGVRG